MLNTIKKRVAYIMATKVNTRNSDAMLTYEYYKKYHLKDDLFTPADMIQMLKLSPTINRVRRKIQNETKVLLPTSEEVAIQRRMKADEWRELMNNDKKYETNGGSRIAIEVTHGKR